MIALTFSQSQSNFVEHLESALDIIMRKVCNRSLGLISIPCYYVIARSLGLISIPSYVTCNRVYKVLGAVYMSRASPANRAESILSRFMVA